MENGQITQQGSFKELAQQTGLFKHLLDANQTLTQANKENLDA
jgi:ATP-binding cassette subfamily C protein CydD